MNIIVGLSIAICALIFAAIGLIFCMICWIEVKSLQKSTHSIQFVPADSVPRDKDGFEILTKKTKEELEQQDIELE